MMLAASFKKLYMYNLIYCVKLSSKEEFQKKKKKKKREKNGKKKSATSIKLK